MIQEADSIAGEACDTERISRSPAGRTGENLRNSDVWNLLSVRLCRLHRFGGSRALAERDVVGHVGLQSFWLHEAGSASLPGTDNVSGVQN